MSFISVLVKRPGEIPRHVNVSNSLEALQKNVGGYIETVTLATDLVIICNEEGLLRDLPENCRIRGYMFVGTIVICGRDEDELTDLPCSWKEMKQMLPELWRGEEQGKGQA